MTSFDFTFAGADLTALGSGALWWRAQQMLCVSDLHLGKSERQARRIGRMLPPYDSQETLHRLASDLALTAAQQVICLGDSFDDAAAALALPAAEHHQLATLMLGRSWIWITGNHDLDTNVPGGTQQAETRLGPLTFRHIADPAAAAEVSGHYHPKVRLRSGSRPAFLLDSRRLILPAYGTYTGGLRSSDPALSGLMGSDALAILTGPKPMPVPMPRR